MKDLLKRKEELQKEFTTNQENVNKINARNLEIRGAYAEIERQIDVKSKKEYELKREDKIKEKELKEVTKEEKKLTQLSSL